MALSEPAARETIHTRRVECRGYRRADGLWDIEGHMTDVKSYGFDNAHRGRIEAGTPVHDMWLRLTVDDRLTIVAAEARTEAAPFAVCAAINPAYEKLVGLSLRPGFTRKSREALGGVKGCTHLTELLGPVATTAFQTVAPIIARERAEREEATGRKTSEGRPAMLNTCHAYASDGPVVRERWPAWHTGAEKG